MPLRPDLYRRLCQRAHQYRFGEVHIIHEGVEMRASVDYDALSNKPRLNVIEAGEYYAVACPFCNDTRHRLWINHMWGYYHPQTRSRNLWLCICYNERCLETYERQRALYDMVYNDITNGRSPVADPVIKGTRSRRGSGEVRPPMDVVYGLHDFPADHPANLYLQARGYDPSVLGRQLGIGYCPTAYPEFRLASDRIIIPLTNGGKYVGWQARCIGDPPSKDVPKYYSMPCLRKTEVLYNLDVAKHYRFVVIVEGATDVWRVGPASVALLGKSLSTFQKHFLATNWGTGAVVVLLDADAQEDAQRIYDALAGLVRHRVLVQLPEGYDPGDFNQADLWRLIYEAARQQGVDLATMNGSQRQ